MKKVLAWSHQPASCVSEETWINWWLFWDRQWWEGRLIPWPNWVGRSHQLRRTVFQFNTFIKDRLSGGINENIDYQYRRPQQVKKSTDCFWLWCACSLCSQVQFFTNYRAHLCIIHTDYKTRGSLVLLWNMPEVQLFANFMPPVPSVLLSTLQNHQLVQLHCCLAGCYNLCALYGQLYSKIKKTSVPDSQDKVHTTELLPHLENSSFFPEIGLSSDSFIGEGKWIFIFAALAVPLVGEWKASKLHQNWLNWRQIIALSSPAASFLSLSLLL